LARDKIQHISLGLGQLVKQLGLGERLRQQRVLDEWARMVGERIAAVSRPERIQDGVLYVRVSSASWRMELLFQKALILEKIATALGEDLVKDIRYI